MPTMRVACNKRWRLLGWTCQLLCSLDTTEAFSPPFFGLVLALLSRYFASLRLLPLQSHALEALYQQNWPQNSSFAASHWLVVVFGAVTAGEALVRSTAIQPPSFRGLAWAWRPLYCPPPMASEGYTLFFHCDLSLDLPVKPFPWMNSLSASTWSKRSWRPMALATVASNAISRTL